MGGKKFASAFILFLALFSLLSELSCSAVLRGDSLIQLSSAPSSKSDEADSSKKRPAGFGGYDDQMEINQETSSVDSPSTPPDAIIVDSPCTSDPGEAAAKLADANDAANNK